MSWMDFLLFVALPVGIVGAWLMYRHQCVLKERAQMMRDAIRYRDFMFRLPTKGLLFGEKALQEALNDMGGEIQKLVANNEIEAWQRLTRVLTHEIMNATAPIQSISQAYLRNPNIKGSPYEEGIRAIHDTSMGLSHFVDSYRKLTLLQEPVMGEMNVRDFCQSVASTYPELTWKIDVPESMVWSADENLMRQVFINMVKNAQEAGATCIGIGCNTSPEAGRKGICISNNGNTIPDDVAREIFIPFFTTKPTGSGIGLSLCRQILMMQAMSLSLRERPLMGYNVTFVLE